MAFQLTLLLQTEKMDWLKGKDSEMLPAGACESRIFGEGEKSSRNVVEEYVMGPERSVFMMPTTKAAESVG